MPAMQVSREEVLKMAYAVLSNIGWHAYCSSRTVHVWVVRPGRNALDSTARRCGYIRIWHDHHLRMLRSFNLHAVIMTVLKGLYPNISRGRFRQLCSFSTCCGHREQKYIWCRVQHHRNATLSNFGLRLVCTCHFVYLHMILTAVSVRRGTSVLAFISVASLPIPYLFWRFGERLRARPFIA